MENKDVLLSVNINAAFATNRSSITYDLEYNAASLIIHSGGNNNPIMLDFVKLFTLFFTVETR